MKRVDLRANTWESGNHSVEIRNLNYRLRPFDFEKFVSASLLGQRKCQKVAYFVELAPFQPWERPVLTLGNDGSNEISSFLTFINFFISSFINFSSQLSPLNSAPVMTSYKNKTENEHIAVVSTFTKFLEPVVQFLSRKSFLNNQTPVILLSGVCSV